MIMTLSHCTNNGNTTVNEGGVGGFISGIYINKNTSVVFSDCINNGNVMGGLLGELNLPRQNIPFSSLSSTVQTKALFQK